MSHILSNIDAGVLTLTFNRVDRKNAVTTQMYAELAAALTEASSNAAVRVVVIQAQAQIFCAGNDMEDFLAATKESRQAPQGERPVFQFLHGIANFPKPIVAAVCGPAVGIGATLLLHCDLVYAGDNAAMSFPFVNLGICPEAASTLILPQMLGYHRAAEALLLGEPIHAEAALEVGLVNKVLPPTEANDYAQSVAKKLAAKPLASLIETKRLMKKVDMNTVHERMDDEGVIFGRMLTEPAAREAMTAFMQKRKPDFSKC